MSNVMLDIETLGTEPGAAVVSVGAVRFDETGVGAEFMSLIDLESSEEAGLEIDAETLKWWLTQSDAAQEQLISEDDLDSVLSHLSEFIGEAHVWANSPAFDCTILGHAYNAVDQEPPWRYTRCRDYRTMREHPSTWPDIERSSVEHDALDDARYQATMLIQAISEADDVSL